MVPTRIQFRSAFLKTLPIPTKSANNGSSNGNGTDAKPADSTTTASIIANKTARAAAARVPANSSNFEI